MRFVVRVALVALAAESALAFAPNSLSSSTKSSSELNALSHYSRQKPFFHPDARTNMNNIEIDEFTGMPHEEAEAMREERRLRAQMLAEELRREDEAVELARIEAQEAAAQMAAEERASIRAADEAEARALAEAREEARKLAEEQGENLKNGDYHFASVPQDSDAPTPEEITSANLKASLSDEDVEKMVSLRGWRRMQFMDNTLDGTIIKRFPRKHPDHPDSRTNNKHIDMNDYVELTMEEYEAAREEARLEARRWMGVGKKQQAELAAAQAEERLASVKMGKALAQTVRRVENEESNNRIFLKKY